MKTLVTHYDSLQVSQTASASVIRAAFKALSQKLHPDKHQHNPSVAHKNFHIIKQAYEVLSNPKLRQQYDRWINSRKVEKKASNKKSKQLFNYYSVKEKKSQISIKV